MAAVVPRVHTTFKKLCNTNHLFFLVRCLVHWKICLVCGTNFMLESCIMTETNWLGYTFHVRRAPRNNIMGLLWDGVKTKFLRYFFHRKTSCMGVWGWFKKEIYRKYFSWVGIMINLIWANTVIIWKWSILLLGHADQSLLKRHKSINLARVWYISI